MSIYADADAVTTEKPASSPAAAVPMTNMGAPLALGGSDSEGTIAGELGSGNTGVKVSPCDAAPGCCCGAARCAARSGRCSHEPALAIAPAPAALHLCCPIPAALTHFALRLQVKIPALDAAARAWKQATPNQQYGVYGLAALVVVYVVWPGGSAAVVPATQAQLATSECGAKPCPSMKLAGGGGAHGVRLTGGAASHEGRIEIYDPAMKKWGTMCGHWFWDNNNAGNMVCQALGYSGGQLYTYGVDSTLKKLPIITGYRVCGGGEGNILNCPAHKDGPAGGCAKCKGASYAVPGGPCFNPKTVGPAPGCRGACNHHLDQGVVCETTAMAARSSVSRKMSRCRGCGTGCSLTNQASNNNGRQSVFFGCTQFYSTYCTASTKQFKGNFAAAMQAFAKCAEVCSGSNPPASCAGYCHGAITSAGHLRNEDVCVSHGNANNNQDIGFKIRIPFRVVSRGHYSFRLHGDYGRGSFVNIDGNLETAKHIPGNTWGYLLFAGAGGGGIDLTVGDHEITILGFEDCCDGHAELEVHLPCDKPTDPWRTVTAGGTDCLACTSRAGTKTSGMFVPGGPKNVPPQSGLPACCQSGQTGAAQCGVVKDTVQCSKTTQSSVAPTAQTATCMDVSDTKPLSGAMSLQGSSWVKYNNGLNPRGELFTVSYSFKTSVQTGVMVLVGMDRGHAHWDADHLVIQLIAGNVVAHMSPGGKKSAIKITNTPVTPTNYADNKWHTVSFSRTGRQAASLHVDATTTKGVSCTMSGTCCPGGAAKCGECKHHAGPIGPKNPRYACAGVDLNLPVYYGGHPDVCSARHAGLDSPATNFQGCLGVMQYQKNFGLQSPGFDQTNNAALSGTCGTSPAPGYTAAQTRQMKGKFKHWNSGMVNVLTTPFSIDFSFKTTGANGALFSTGSGKGSHWGDYIIIEMVGGKIHFVYHVGCGAVNAVSAMSTRSYNDGKWHSVQAKRTGPHMGVLTIDGVNDPQNTVVGAGKCTAVNVNAATVFIGGLPKGKAKLVKPSDVALKQPNRMTIAPFIGCLTDFKVTELFKIPRYTSRDTHSVRFQVCTDHIDYLHIQPGFNGAPGQVWLEYGGSWSAAGQHPSCPRQYRSPGRVYIDGKSWDVNSLRKCKTKPCSAGKRTGCNLATGCGTGNSCCSTPKKNIPKYSPSFTTNVMGGAPVPIVPGSRPLQPLLQMPPTWSDQTLAMGASAPGTSRSCEVIISKRSGRGTVVLQSKPVNRNDPVVAVISDAGFGAAAVYDFTVHFVCH